MKSEFEVLRMKQSETIDDFAMRLTIIANRIRGLGDKMGESTIVKKFLRAITPKFLQIVSTIEQFGDMQKMTVEEVISRLKAFEERFCGTGIDDHDDNHALLTRAKWKEKESSEGSTSKSLKG